MSANTIDTTTYNTVAANTVNNAVISASAILSWRQNVKAVVDQHATEIDSKASKTQPAWIAPTLLNSWGNFGGSLAVAGYYKDEVGLVHLKGYISGGTATSGTNLFTLPAGYRPSETHRFTTHGYNGTNQVIVILNVDNTGAVSILNANSSTQIDLDIPPFRAEV